jgi:predicted PurR-regulated permease PerM
MTPQVDRILSLFRERTFSRVFAIALFLTLLFLFRHLAAVAVFFVAFERSFRFLAEHLNRRTKLSEKQARLFVLAVFLLAVAGGVAFGAVSGFRSFRALRATSPEWIEELREHPLVQRVQSEIGDGDSIVNHAKTYAGEALRYASLVGRFFLQALLGFVLAVVYLLDEREIDAFEAKIAVKSIVGRLLRWFGHVADAVSVTLQLQLIVAVFNTVTTMPVLLLLGIPHVPSLMVLIFASALVPVVGNLAVGGMLCLMAFQAKGWFGVAVFVGVTFLLHKIESYYLSPRLTARHVRLPGFVLICALIVSEHLFGFAGVFLSFPALFVAGKIRAEFLQEDAEKEV